MVLDYETGDTELINPAEIQAINKVISALNIKEPSGIKTKKFRKIKPELIKLVHEDRSQGIKPKAIYNHALGNGFKTNLAQIRNILYLYK